MWFSANIALAQTFASKVEANPAANSIIAKLMQVIVLPLATLLFVLTGVLFIWGVAQMIIKRDDPDARKDGQRHVLWGVIGIFIMVSVFGIIKVISNTVCPENSKVTCAPF